MRPGSTSDAICSMRALAAIAAAWFTAAITIVPSSWMSICVPVSLVTAFVTPDGGQDRELVAFLGQAQRDARDRRLHRHAGIDRRPGGPADRGHRGGPGRLGRLRNAADGGRGGFHRRHDSQRAALAETAV